MAQGHDTKTPFYIYLPVVWAGGTLDLPNADGVACSTDLRELQLLAQAETEAFGAEGVIYRCAPVDMLLSIGEEGDED